MSRPYFFTWVDEPLLAACAWPDSAEQLSWLRKHGTDFLITLTEENLPRNWIDDAGLMSVHIPIDDMHPPTMEQMDHLISVIDKARDAKMGVTIHCLAGKGRTGTALAAYMVSRGLTADQAIDRVRDLRPGSLEVSEQEYAVHEFERRLRRRSKP